MNYLFSTNNNTDLLFQVVSLLFLQVSFHSTQRQTGNYYLNGHCHYSQYHCHVIVGMMNVTIKQMQYVYFHLP